MSTPKQTLKFKPIHDNHSIYACRLVLLLNEPVENPLDFGKQLAEKQKVVTSFHEMRKIEARFGEGEPQFKESSPNGFVLLNDMAGDGKNFALMNNEIRPSFVFTTNMYDRWAGFIKEVNIVFKSISELLPDYKLTAVGLEYTDKFKWLGTDDNFDWKYLFNTKSTLLPRDFTRHQHISFDLTRIRRDISDGANLSAVEKLSVHRLQDSSVDITHHVSLALPDNTTLKKFNSKPFQTNLAAIHVFNKQILRKLLKAKILKQIGIDPAN